MAGMTNRADAAEMPSQIAIRIPISACRRRDEKLQMITLVMSVSAVTRTPRPELLKALVMACSMLLEPWCNSSRMPSTI